MYEMQNYSENPAHKNVILGIITSKFPELEDKERMKERVYAAAEIIIGGGASTSESRGRYGVIYKGIGWF
jgi:methionine synthase II (cobalamin-independent)